MTTFQDVISELAYLPFPEGMVDEDFSDYDSAYDLNACLYVTGGIVCEKQFEGQYQELIEMCHKRFK